MGYITGRVLNNETTKRKFNDENWLGSCNYMDLGLGFLCKRLYGSPSVCRLDFGNGPSGSFCCVDLETI